jgi:hypothetical protein
MTTQYTILDARPTSRKLPTERYVLLGTPDTLIVRTRPQSN